MKKYSFEQMRHIDRFTLTVKRMQIGQNVNLNFHSHDFSEIAIIIAAGNTFYWCNGKSYLLAPGDVILLHPGSVHAYENTADLELVNLIYDASQLPLPQMDGCNLKLFHALVDSNYISENPEQPILHLEKKDLEDILTFIQRMELELQNDLPGSRLYIFGLFLSLLILLSRKGETAKQNRFSASVAQALHYLNLHFRENISIDFLARMSNMSRTGFFVAFKAHCGCTPVAYQQEKRLALAAKLLSAGNKSLGEIASECGFCDSNYLSKLFKRKFGMSPGRMRRSQRQEQEPRLK